MTRQEILDRVREVLHREVGYHGPVRPEHDLAVDLGLDSVSLLTLLVELENAFRVVLEPRDGEAPPTRVGDVVELIERELADAEAAA
jgi:acyl carrier protein